MGRSLFYNVMMVIMLMVMDVPGIVRFRLGLLVQEVALIVKIIAIYTDHIR